MQKEKFEKAESLLENGNYAEAAGILNELMENGYCYAGYKLGEMHENGEGMPRSESEALECYKKAAETGFYPAQVAIYRMLKYGQGVEPCILDICEKHRSNMNSVGNEYTVIGAPTIARSAYPKAFDMYEIPMDESIYILVSDGMAVRKKNNWRKGFAVGKRGIYYRTEYSAGFISWKEYVSLEVIYSPGIEEEPDYIPGVIAFAFPKGQVFEWQPALSTVPLKALMQEIQVLMMQLLNSWASTEENYQINKVMPESACTFREEALKMLDTTEHEEGLERLKLMAEEGDARAAYELGHIYETGEHCEQQDMEKSVKWYMIAKQNGSSSALQKIRDFWKQEKAMAAIVAAICGQYKIANNEQLVVGKPYVDATYAIYGKIKKFFPISSADEIVIAISHFSLFKFNLWKEGVLIGGKGIYFVDNNLKCKGVISWKEYTEGIELSTNEDKTTLDFINYSFSTNPHRPLIKNVQWLPTQIGVTLGKDSGVEELMRILKEIKRLG